MDHDNSHALHRQLSKRDELLPQRRQNTRLQQYPDTASHSPSVRPGGYNNVPERMAR